MRVMRMLRGHSCVVMRRTEEGKSLSTRAPCLMAIKASVSVMTPGITTSPCQIALWNHHIITGCQTFDAQANERSYG